MGGIGRVDHTAWYTACDTGSELRDRLGFAPADNEEYNTNG